VIQHTALFNSTLEKEQVGKDLTFFHTAKWKEVLMEEFGYESAYLSVPNAVLPAFIQNFGPFNALVSLPKSDYGGPVASNLEALVHLCQELFEHCNERGVTYARLCLLNPLHVKLFQSYAEYVSLAKGVMELDLSQVNSEFVWNHVFSSRTRKHVRHLEKSSFQAYEASSLEELKAFYRVYNLNIRHLGATPHDFSFLQRVWQHLYSSNVRVWLMGKTDVVGGLLVLKDQTACYSYFLGIDREKAPKYSIYQYLFWRELLRAQNEGLKKISLGSTPSNSQDVHYKIKKEFGATFHQQQIMWIPTNAKGHLLLQMRRHTENAWKQNRHRLPRELKRIIENRLVQL
jgi:hypothetical protein